MKQSTDQCCTCGKKLPCKGWNLKCIECCEAEVAAKGPIPPVVNLAHVGDTKLELVKYPSGIFLELITRRDPDNPLASLCYSERTDNLIKIISNLDRGLIG